MTVSTDSLEAAKFCSLGSIHKTSSSILGVASDLTITAVTLLEKCALPIARLDKEYNSMSTPITWVNDRMSFVAVTRMWEDSIQLAKDIERTVTCL